MNTKQLTNKLWRYIAFAGTVLCLLQHAPAILASENSSNDFENASTFDERPISDKNNEEIVSDDANEESEDNDNSEAETIIKTKKTDAGLFGNLFSTENLFGGDITSNMLIGAGAALLPHSILGGLVVGALGLGARCFANQEELLEAKNTIFSKDENEPNDEDSMFPLGSEAATYGKNALKYFNNNVDITKTFTNIATPAIIGLVLGLFSKILI